MVSSGLAVACLASCLVFLLIYIPLTSFFMWKLLGIRHSSIYKARLSHIALIGIIAVVVHLFVSSIYLLEIGGYIPINFEYFQYVPFFILSYSLLLRFGLYHFKIQFEYLTENQEWKAIIDGNMEQEMKEDFYLVNKGKYGSWKWLIKRFWILPFLGGVIFPIIIHSLIGNINNIYIATIYYIALISMLILTFISVFGVVYIVGAKLESFNDTLYVLDEFAKLKILSVLNLLCTAILIGSLLSISDNVFEDGHDDQILIVMCLEHLAAFLLILLVYFTSYYVVTKLINNLSIVPRSVLKRRGSDSMSRSITYSSKSTTQSPTNSNNNNDNDNNGDNGDNTKELTKLDFILSNDLTLDLFMLHLKKEFQMEILLSFIEFTQFRLVVDENLKNNDNNLNINNGKDVPLKRMVTASRYGYEAIILSPGCPYSSILKNKVPDDIMEEYNDCERSAKVVALCYKAHLLFNKYIRSSTAEFEINISYHLRKRLSIQFGDLNALINNDDYSDIVNFDQIWSKVLEEQWKYCTNSLTRFKNSPDFQRIKEHFRK